MTPQQMVQMDKDVIERLLDFMNNTTKINGFNRGQLEEGKTEIERLCNQIMKKAKTIGGSFLAEQEIYTGKILNEVSKSVYIK